MRVPNWEGAIIERRKLSEYLLSPTHPVGRYKARYFANLGYEAVNSEALEASLRAILDSDNPEAIDGEFGTKFVVRGSITGPNGTEARLTTVWIILVGEETPRFVTAYPENPDGN